MAPAGGWVGSLWPMTTRGCFVVLDGPDGGGKTTQALRLVRRLQAAGRDVLHVRDPGSTVVGERIRDVLLDPALGEVVPMCEMLLYQAARAQLAGFGALHGELEGRSIALGGPPRSRRPGLEHGRIVLPRAWAQGPRA